MTSTAFFHSLTICGYMLCIVKEVAEDMRSHYKNVSKDSSPSCTSVASLSLGSDMQVLMEVVPKVQATGCRRASFSSPFCIQRDFVCTVANCCVYMLQGWFPFLQPEMAVLQAGDANWIARQERRLHAASRASPEHGITPPLRIHLVHQWIPHLILPPLLLFPPLDPNP
jgi:hypothetical protein